MSKNKRLKTDLPVLRQTGADKKPELIGQKLSPTKFHHLLSISLILIISIAVYSNTLKNGFVYDDRFTIVDNLFIKNWNNLPELFSKTYFSRSGEETYRPIVTLSYFVDYSLWGLKPFGYHLTNLLLHSANVVLVYLFALLLLNNPLSPTLLRGSNITHTHTYTRWIAFFTALLFSIHPIQSEAVNAISFREDLLVVFFLTAAFLILSPQGRGEGEGDRGLSLTFYLVSLFLYLLALLSKEMAVTFPLLLIGYYLCFTQDKNLISHRGTEAQRTTPPFLNHLIGYIVVTLIYLFLYFFTFSNPNPEISLQPDILTRLLTLPKVIVKYLWLILIPLDLNTDYVVMFSRSWTDPSVVFSVFFLMGIGAAVFHLSKRYRKELFGLLWFFVSLLPVMNIVPINNVIAERYLYFPFVGISLFLSRWLVYLYGVIPPRLWKRGLITITAISILFFGIRTHLRNMDWRDNLTLWSKTVIVSPESARAHHGLGNAYEEMDEYEKAIQEYQTALRLKPYFVEAHYNLGNAYAKQGRLNEAIQEYQIALRLNPEYANAHNNLGNVYSDQGQLDKAMQEYRIALKLNPNDGEAYNNLGNVYAKQGRLDESIQEYQIALRLNPDHVKAHYNLGLVYAEQGRLNESRKKFETVLRLKPDDKDAYQMLESLSRSNR